jgi:hypothetical protein
MSVPWTSFAEVAETLIKGNFSDWTLHERNRTLARPTPKAVTDPVKILQFDFAVQRQEIQTGGRTLIANGYLAGTCWLQGNTKDSPITDFLDRLQAVSDAWARTTEAAALCFYQVAFSEMGYIGDAMAPQYCFREWELPFLYLNPISDQGVGILGGISASTIQVNAPALGVGQFVGVDGGAWRRVRALPGEPSCRGMVSMGPNGDGNVLVVLSGFVRVPGHGYPVGPLFLSQVTPGSAGAAPDNGISRQVAEVLNETDLIVLGEKAEEEL